MALPKIAKITWGTAFANTWTFAEPPDNPIPDFERFATAEAESGERTAWVDRERHRLKIIARFVPKNDLNGATGFSGATGAYQAILWLAKGNAGRYYFDKDGGSYHAIYLVDFNIDRDKGGSHYRIELTIEDANGTPFTDGY